MVRGRCRGLGDVSFLVLMILRTAYCVLRNSYEYVELLHFTSFTSFTFFYFYTSSWMDGLVDGYTTYLMQIHYQRRDAVFTRSNLSVCLSFFFSGVRRC